MTTVAQMSGQDSDFDPEYPCLPAWLVYRGRQVVIFCRYCRRFHWHGGGDACFGHRLAHCFVHGSRYDDRGYILINAGAPSPQIMADLDRQCRGRWPFRTVRSEAEWFRVDDTGAVRRRKTLQPLLKIRSRGIEHRVVGAN